MTTSDFGRKATMSGSKTTCHCIHGSQIFMTVSRKLKQEFLCNGKVAKFQNNRGKCSFQIPYAVLLFAAFALSLDYYCRRKCKITLHCMLIFQTGLHCFKANRTSFHAEKWQLLSGVVDCLSDIV